VYRERIAKASARTTERTGEHVEQGNALASRRSARGPQEGQSADVRKRTCPVVVKAGRGRPQLRGEKKETFDLSKKRKRNNIHGLQNGASARRSVEPRPGGGPSHTWHTVKNHTTALWAIGDLRRGKGEKKKRNITGTERPARRGPEPRASRRGGASR